MFVERTLRRTVIRMENETMTTVKRLQVATLFRANGAKGVAVRDNDDFP